MKQSIPASIAIAPDQRQWTDQIVGTLRQPPIPRQMEECSEFHPAANQSDSHDIAAIGLVKNGWLSRRSRALQKKEMNEHAGPKTMPTTKRNQSSQELSFNLAPAQEPAVEHPRGLKRDSAGQMVEKQSIPSVPGTHVKKHNGLFVRMPFRNEEHERLVQQFNTALAKASRATYGDNYRLELWGSYTELKEQYAESLQHIPKPAWKRLWKTQASFRPTDTQRLGNLETLVSDMEAHTGHGIQVEKLVVLLEKMLADGQENEALAAWHSHCESMLKFRRRELGGSQQAEGGFESEKRKEWLELGVRLHALAGDTDGASHLTQRILRQYRNCDPRFIFVQILALNHWPDRILHRRAWSLYLQLRILPKFSMCLDDFQGLFHSFLRAGEQRCALVVLRDMTKLDISQNTLTPIVVECIEALHKSCTTRDELEKHAISALSVVPVQLQSRDLYTSWLAQTCNLGLADDMARIIELMFERGIDPATNHLDGLVRAWLESTDHDATKKGERLAWNMIQKHEDPSEMNFVKRLWYSRSAIDSKHGTRVSTYDPRIFTARPITKASGKTFIRLARYYANRGYADYARHVVALLMSTDIRPTRGQVRAILGIYTKLGDFAGVWQFFQAGLSNSKLRIDLGTYSTVWQALIQQLHRQIFQPRELRDSIYGLPSARELFHHMQNFIRLHGPISMVTDDRAYKKSSMPKNLIASGEANLLYKRIIRTFALSKDTFGALLALRSLHLSLGMAPTLDIITTLIHHAAHEAMVAECKLQNRYQNVQEYMPMSMQVLASLYQFSDPEAPTERTDAARELLSDGIRKKGVGLLSLLEGFLGRVVLGGMSREQIALGLREAQVAMGLRKGQRSEDGFAVSPMLV